jgi:hypothetical protein
MTRDTKVPGAERERGEGAPVGSHGPDRLWHRVTRAGPAAALTALLVSAALAAPAEAQAPTACRQFRVEWNNRERSPTSTKLTGFVYNESRCRVTSVRLHVVAVDADGRAVAETSAWVFGTIQAGGRGYFIVPLTTPAADFRVNVISFDELSREGP